MQLKYLIGASFAVTAAAFAAIGGALTPAQAQEFQLRAVANSNENDEDFDGLIVFKDFVESRSNGQIGVELFIGTQLCANGTECLQAVEDGIVDIYISTSGGAANIFPFVQVLDLPYILTSDRVAEAVLEGEFQDQMRTAALDQSDDKLRLMTIGNTGGWRNFANTQRQIQQPSDLDGLKIRTIVADLPQELVKAMGASPTPIPWPELFTSFQTGVVEGSKNGITDIVGMSFPDAGLKYLTLDGHAYMAALWWMNNDRFMGMSPELRQVIVDGFVELQQATFASPKRKSIQAYQDFLDADGEIYVPTPDQKAAFQAAAEPVYDWFSGNVADGDVWLDRLRTASADAQAGIDASNATRLQ